MRDEFGQEILAQLQDDTKEMGLSNSWVRVQDREFRGNPPKLIAKSTFIRHLAAEKWQNVYKYMHAKAGGHLGSSCKVQHRNHAIS